MAERAVAMAVANPPTHANTYTSWCMTLKPTSWLRKSSRQDQGCICARKVLQSRLLVAHLEHLMQQPLSKLALLLQGSTGQERFAELGVGEGQAFLHCVFKHLAAAIN